MGVESAGEGHGCTFYLEIPMEVGVVPAAEAESPALQAIADSLCSSPRSAFRNVLMVEHVFRKWLLRKLRLSRAVRSARCFPWRRSGCRECRRCCLTSTIIGGRP